MRVTCDVVTDCLHEPPCLMCQAIVTREFEAIKKCKNINDCDFVERKYNNCRKFCYFLNRRRFLLILKFRKIQISILKNNFREKSESDYDFDLDFSG